MLVIESVTYVCVSTTTNDSDFVWHKFLNLIGSLEIEAGRIVIKKTAVATHLRENKKILYNFVTAEYIMRDVLAAYGDTDHINLHLDLSMSKSSRQAFDRYFAEKVSWKTFVSNNDRLITSNVFHDYSHQQPAMLER